MNKLLCYVNAHVAIGRGHLVRTLVYADRFEGEVLFVTTHMESVSRALVPYPVMALEPTRLIEAIAAHAVTHVLLDDYEIPTEIEAAILKHAHLTVIEDRYVPHICNRLINPNIYAQKSGYAGLVPLACEIIGGAVLLRQPFLNHTPKARRFPKKITVGVVMGATDPLELTPRIAQLLEGIDVHTLKTHQSDMYGFLSRMDLIICTPSTVLQESMRLALPFVAVQVASNQELFTAFLEVQGLPVLRSFEPKAFLEAFQALLDPVTYEQTSRNIAALWKS